MLALHVPFRPIQPVMKFSAVIAIALLYSFSNFASAAEPHSGRNVQNGRLSSARLLATARVPGGAVPDGMRFLFLVTRTSDAKGQLTLKDTRVVLIDRSSYQEKTQSELRKRFEPGTILDTAESFFAKQPGMRTLAPDDIKGAHIVALTVGGTKLSAGAKAEVTLHVGFDKEVEPFTFRVAVPPVSGGAPKS